MSDHFDAGMRACYREALDTTGDRVAASIMVLAATLMQGSTGSAGIAGTLATIRDGFQGTIDTGGGDDAIRTKADTI